MRIAEKIKEKIKEKLLYGYIRLFRSFLDWEWYSDIPCKVLFLHCLLKANYEPKKWRGEIINTGEFDTSLPHLAEETGLSVQQVRTALKKLQSTGEISEKATCKKRTIKVRNYCIYQDKNLKINRLATGKQQAGNRLATSTNKDNKIIIERELGKDFEILIKYAEYKRAKNPIAYADKIMKSDNIDEVIKSIKKELENAKKEEEKKKKLENEKLEEEKQIQESCKVEIFSDEEILEELKKAKGRNSHFKSPILKKYEKEAEKRGLKIC